MALSTACGAEYDITSRANGAIMHSQVSQVAPHTEAKSNNAMDTQVQRAIPWVRAERDQFYVHLDFFLVARSRLRGAARALVEREGEVRPLVVPARLCEQWTHGLLVDMLLWPHMQVTLRSPVSHSPWKPQCRQYSGHSMWLSRALSQHWRKPRP